jgi:hypothetical protein
MIMNAKNKKIFIASSIIGALAITVAAIILTSKRKKLQTLIKAGSPDVLVPAYETTPMSIFPLNFASGRTTAEMNDIKVVQRYLNAKNTNLSLFSVPLSEDGIFGPKTRAALLSAENVSEVTETLYQSMVDYLSSQGTADPSVAKNDLTQ